MITQCFSLPFSKFRHNFNVTGFKKTKKEFLDSTIFTKKKKRKRDVEISITHINDRLLVIPTEGTMF
jgi:hypothetical protein